MSTTMTEVAQEMNVTRQQVNTSDLGPIQRRRFVEAERDIGRQLRSFYDPQHAGIILWSPFSSPNGERAVIADREYLALAQAHDFTVTRKNLKEWLSQLAYITGLVKPKRPE